VKSKQNLKEQLKAGDHLGKVDLKEEEYDDVPWRRERESDKPNLSWKRMGTNRVIL
jgi:hypothetical protein